MLKCLQVMKEGNSDLLMSMAEPKFRMHDKGGGTKRMWKNVLLVMSLCCWYTYTGYC